MAPEAKALDRLLARIQQETRLLTAFSGGADSALLAWAAHQVLGEAAVAVTAVSASLPASERAGARQFAHEHGLRHLEVCTDELERPSYIRNLSDRCRHCKDALFDALEPIAELAGARIALGTNLDDLGEHRPGQAVSAIRGAVFPLVDACLTKDDVRAVSREIGLSTADKPPAACLSSRIAYGDPVTPELLRRIELAEKALHQLGIAGCRVRAHANGTVARIEVDVAGFNRVVARRTDIVHQFRSAGFTFVAIDLSNFRSGSMNALLPLRLRSSQPDHPRGAE